MHGPLNVKFAIVRLHFTL